MGKSTKEMNKALEMGQVTAKDLLPKMIPLMDKLANKNGALAKQINNAQAAQNRFLISAQEGGDVIWLGGMSEGFKDFMITLQKTLEGSGPQLKKIGKIFGWFFNALSKGIEVVTPLLKVLIDNIELLMVSLGLLKINAAVTAFAALANGVVGANVAVLSGAAAWRAYGVSMLGAWTASAAPMAVIIAGLATISEWFSTFDDSTYNSLDITRGYQMVDDRKMELKVIKGEVYRTGVDLGAGDGVGRTLDEWQYAGAEAIQNSFSAGSRTVGQAISGISNVFHISMTGDVSPDQANKISDSIADKVTSSFNQPKGASK